MARSKQINTRDLKTPIGYRISRTEQWEWTMWGPNGLEFTAASEEVLLVLAHGIEFGKSLARRKK